MCYLKLPISAGITKGTAPNKTHQIRIKQIYTYIYTNKDLGALGSLQVFGKPSAPKSIQKT